VSKNISFGEKPLSFSGRAPEWSKLGVLVPLVVLANLIMRICPTLPVPGLLSVYGICAALSLGLVKLVHRHPQHIKTGMTAGLAAGVGIASLYFGPMLLAASNSNHASGTFGVGALTISMCLNLAREGLVLAFPHTETAADLEAAAEKATPETLERKARRLRRRRDRE